MANMYTEASTMACDCSVTKVPIHKPTDCSGGGGGGGGRGKYSIPFTKLHTSNPSSSLPLPPSSPFPTCLSGHRVEDQEEPRTEEGSGCWVEPTGPVHYEEIEGRMEHVQGKFTEHLGSEVGG